MGSGSTAGNDYPNQMMALLGAKWDAPNNIGVVSQTIQQMQSDAASQIDPMRRGNLRTVIVWGGTNDLQGGASAATTYSRIVTYCQARKAAGWKVIVLSILPRQASSTFETDRQTVNASLLADFPTTTAFTNIRRGGTYADVFVNVGADATIGAPGSQNNTTYYDADTIHLKNAGYAIVAALAKDAHSLITY